MHQQMDHDGVMPAVSFADACRVWIKVALLSFGGPAGQIAVMHRLLVEEKQWISEQRFLHALNYCMLLPGPEAQQLATYVGWLLHGTRGGLFAGIVFILPGFLSILLLSLLYVSFSDAPWLVALFFGIKAAVVAIVVQALIKIAKRALSVTAMYGIACASFVGIFFLGIPFPLLIGASALVGLLLWRWAPDQLPKGSGHQGPASSAPDSTSHRTATQYAAPPPARAPHGHLPRVLLTWLPLWLVPLAVLALWLGVDNVFTQIGWFFSKLAVVTFGGAYAVLAYMTQAAVEHYGWLTHAEMLDGLGMAESTPGPLIQIVQFVGFLAAYRDPGAIGPIEAAILASLLATWMTFVPCFLWIFLGAPYVEALRNQRSLSAALSAITAAVVGTIASIAVWFGLQFLFSEVQTVQALGLLKFPVPEVASLHWEALALSVVALIALLRLRIGAIKVILGCAVTAILYSFVAG